MIEESGLMQKPQVKGLTPQEANEMVHSSKHAFLVDIRSSMEFLFVGHPVGAVHVPWVDEPEWDVDPNFTTNIRKLMLGGAEEIEGRPSVPIILICRSGKRSKVAGDKLIEEGLTNVYHIDEGFEGDRDDKNQRGNLGGWRFRGLPWEQC